MNRAVLGVGMAQEDEVAELTGKIAHLEALRSVLGDEITDQKKAELAQQLQALIATGGGAFVAGNVQTAGDFAGRDMWNITINPNDPPDELLKAYYRSLGHECCRLPLGVIDTQFVRTANEAAIPLPDIYVDLDVIAAQAPADENQERAWSLRLLRGEGGDRSPVLTALAEPNYARAVLLGDPGSGKTTFVSYLGYLLARGSKALPEPLRGGLVVRLVLREVAARHIPPDCEQGTAQMLWDALAADVARHLGTAAAERVFPYFQGRLLKEGGFFLLDGLDEVPEARERRRALLESIQALAGVLPADARILVTARPYAYADKRWHLSGFPILVLAPFSAEQVERFIERWYQAVRAPMGWNAETARAKGGQLHTALRERRYIGDLGARPLLLTLMATLHSSWGQLPEDRAALYEETVKLLLGRWQRAREVRGPEGEPVVEPGISEALKAGEERIRLALERLALGVHARQGSHPNREAEPADIAESEILVAFRDLLGQVAPDVLLHYLQDRAGLLLSPREGVYAFPHRSFQEYLAACHLSNQPEFALELRKRVEQDPEWWREVFLLGVGKAKQGGLGSAINILNALLPAEFEDVEHEEDLHWKLAVLAGQALLELRIPEQLTGQPLCEALLKRTRRWLVKLIEEGRLSARERLVGGDVLGGLGDPRFDEHCFTSRSGIARAPSPCSGSSKSRPALSGWGVSVQMSSPSTMSDRRTRSMCRASTSVATR